MGEVIRRIKILIRSYFILLCDQKSPYNKILNLIQVFEGLFRRYYSNLGLERPVEEHNQRIDTIYNSIEDRKIRDWLKGRLKHSNEIALYFRLKKIIQNYEILKQKMGQDVDNFCNDT